MEEASDHLRMDKRDADVLTVTSDTPGGTSTSTTHVPCTSTTHVPASVRDPHVTV